MNENEVPKVSGEPANATKCECGCSHDHEHVRGQTTHAVIVDDAAQFEPNESGDQLPPVNVTVKAGEDGPSGMTGQNGGEICISGSTGTTGRPNYSTREARRSFHRTRHRNGQIMAAPGLAVICPNGSQLRAQKRVGPNDKCPCGSGKKYKKCCLNKG